MMTVGELMSSDVVVLNELDSVLQADRLLKLQRIRHLPVVRGRKLVGLVTHRDILKALRTGMAQQQPQLMGAEDIMATSVRTVHPETPVRDALRLMVENQFGCLPVVDADGDLVGILTEADLVRFADRMLAALESKPALGERSATAGSLPVSPGGA